MEPPKVPFISKDLLLNLQSDCDNWLRRKRHLLDAFKVPRHMGWWDP